MNNFKDTFRAYCGEDRFRKFILKLHDHDKLLFWMQKLMDEFSIKHPNFPSDYESIIKELNICPIHNTELTEAEFDVIWGLIKFPKDYYDAREEGFPFGRNVVFSCIDGPNKKHLLKICEKCQTNEKEWLDKAEFHPI